MLMRLIIGCGLIFIPTLRAQTSSAQIELANLREDVRGLMQRVGELSLRVEQLERENRELRGEAGKSSQTYATVSQLNDAVSDLTRLTKAAAADAKNETLQQVSGQIKELGRQTNAAIDSLTKSQPGRPTGTTAFAEDYPKEGISYVVQRGDTVALIAKKTGAKQADVINANKLTDPSRIQVGQTLFIPGGK